MKVLIFRSLLLSSLVLGLLGGYAEAQEIRYVYDELGRLIAVMDEQGRTAIYEYDEVGNILAIRRSDATGPVAITFFNPTKGPIGTRVEIFGIGFSATPTQNTIAFNGVPVPALEASLTILAAEVPSEATTGPITFVTPPIIVAGEVVKAIRVAATYGGGSTVTYITASGKEVRLQ